MTSFVQVSFLIAFVCQIILIERVFSISDCKNVTCPSGQILDIRSCNCVPLIDCNDQSLSDPPICDQNVPFELKTETLCPVTFLCQLPSVLTNYCQPCYNGGILDTTTCKCKCQYPYKGSHCQFTADPCSVEDDPYCSSIDCFNTTNSNYFYCQRKCMCCKNTMCFNLGTLNSDCSCSCIATSVPGLYDARKGCELVTNNCGNDKSCFISLGLKLSNLPKSTADCNDMQLALCPQACKVCTPPVASSG